MDTIFQAEKSCKVDVNLFAESAWQGMCSVPLAPTLSLMPQQQLMALKAHFKAALLCSALTISQMVR